MENAKTHRLQLALICPLRLMTCPLLGAQEMTCRYFLDHLQAVDFSAHPQRHPLPPKLIFLFLPAVSLHRSALGTAGTPLCACSQLTQILWVGLTDKNEPTLNSCSLTASSSALQPNAVLWRYQKYHDKEPEGWVTMLTLSSVKVTWSKYLLTAAPLVCPVVMTRVGTEGRAMDGPWTRHLSLLWHPLGWQQREWKERPSGMCPSKWLMR